MNNLLLNAIKYTNTGGSITIRSSANVREAEIEVKDTGIGIAPEYLEQIFQPFRRGSKNGWHRTAARAGLAIARRIVECTAEVSGGERGVVKAAFFVYAAAGAARFSAPDSDTLCRQAKSRGSLRFC